MVGGELPQYLRDRGSAVVHGQRDRQIAVLLQCGLGAAAGDDQGRAFRGPDARVGVGRIGGAARNDDLVDQNPAQQGGLGPVDYAFIPQELTEIALHIGDGGGVG